MFDAYISKQLFAEGVQSESSAEVKAIRESSWIWHYWEAATEADAIGDQQLKADAFRE